MSNTNVHIAYYAITAGQLKTTEVQWHKVLPVGIFLWHVTLYNAPCVVALFLLVYTLCDTYTSFRKRMQMTSRTSELLTNDVSIHAWLDYTGLYSYFLFVALVLLKGRFTDENKRQRYGGNGHTVFSKIIYIHWQICICLLLSKLKFLARTLFLFRVT
jgi:hypothetical protein